MVVDVVVSVDVEVAIDVDVVVLVVVVTLHGDSSAARHEPSALQQLRYPGSASTTLRSVQRALMVSQTLSRQNCRQMRLAQTLPSHLSAHLP
jgi:hypothetical protein